jgi:hypothetical protein
VPSSVEPGTLQPTLLGDGQIGDLFAVVEIVIRDFGRSDDLADEKHLFHPHR